MSTNGKPSGNTPPETITSLATVETQSKIEERHARATELAATIKRGLRTFVEVGLAFRELHDGGLYKELGYPNFEKCLLGEFGLERRQYAYEHMQAADVDEALSGIPDKPANLAVSMELFSLLAKPPVLRQAWKAAVKRSRGKAVTAVAVAEIVQRLTLPPEEPETPPPDEEHRHDSEADEAEDLEAETPEEPEEEPWSVVDDAADTIKMAVTDVLRLDLEQRRALSDTLTARIKRGELDRDELQILQGVIQPVLF